MLLSATWYPFLFDTSSPMDFLRSVAFWATIAIAIGLVVGGGNFGRGRQGLSQKVGWRK